MTSRRTVIRKIILGLAFLLVVGCTSRTHAEGISCWIRCHHPPVIRTGAEVAGALRLQANLPLGFLARSTGILTTYLGKLLGVQGWRDLHLRAQVEGTVIQAAHSDDGLHTIDLEICQLVIGSQKVALVHKSFIRIEAFPFRGGSVQVQTGQLTCVSGRLMWDGDGFLEIHPQDASRIVPGPCRS